jgi:MYXO-CTERM domain-containing protein
LVLAAALAAIFSASRPAGAQNLLLNGTLDKTYAQEIVPNFSLPKPADWVNHGTRTLTGPYEDEMSSEPWAGPAPTPVTMDASGLDSPNGVGVGNLDAAVFFKAFSGGGVDGPATGHLQQDVPATPGLRYTLTGWAGAEPNFLGGAEMAIEFLGPGDSLIGAGVLDLRAAGLLTDNGQPFDYKQYQVSAIAPAGTVEARARVSMIDGTPNPLGGGQAYVVDDFVLTVIPEPTSAALGLVGLALLAARSHRRHAA